MSDNAKYDLKTLLEIVADEIDAAYIIDAEKDTYTAIKHSAMFFDMFKENGSYLELSRTLMFHFRDCSENINPEYHVFLPKLNKFNGKYSKRIKLTYKKRTIIVQMAIYPLLNTGKHILFLIEMDNSEYMQEFFTKEKESIINSNSNYLFSMLVDLVKDTCNSVSVTEMSDDPMNYTELKYSQWRMMIVNMIFPDDQPLFLEKTSPEFIRANLKARRSASLDCQMQNLNGKYIWVKLIFHKIETHRSSDFRFVFMVQDIHENYMRLVEDLKKYEELSNLDSLTGIFNHGKIENELYHYIDKRKTDDTPLSLIMLDVDFFKHVNDTFGHSVGDSVLKKIVFLANGCFKEHNIIFGRWGGEEFVGICYGMTKNELFDVAERLRVAVSEFTFESVKHVTCSMGVIEIEPGEETQSAFERVDKALYMAKSSGRNCVICR
ncbi:MAG: GGDEF domain-containing protein [Fibrobacter sp.]|nr:GGDEF domain-containing protein [Fibrobacter sp.]